MRNIYLNISNLATMLNAVGNLLTNNSVEIDKDGLLSLSISSYPVLIINDMDC